MSDMNRRDFVSLTIATAAGVCACGSLAQAGEAPPPNAPKKTGPFDIGPKTDYSKDGVTDTWTKSERILVIRNEGKIYACNSTCTHKNCAVKKKGEEIVCPCHGSKYSLHGTSTKGPAKGSLFRYGVSVDDKGHIIVNRDKQFSEKQWDDAGAFLTV
jgi:nitrite reductase/ring-hydroxylating ferredoxin subunit